MRCLRDKQLQASIDGELSKSDAAELERHLNVCLACRERLAQWKSASERIKAKISQMGPARIPAPPQLHTEKTPRSARISPFWRRLLASYIRVPAVALAMAGIFVVGIAIGTILKGSPRAQGERWLGRQVEAADVAHRGTVSMQVSSVGIDLKDYIPVANPTIFAIKE